MDLAELSKIWSVLALKTNLSELIITCGFENSSGIVGGGSFFPPEYEL